MNEEYVDGSYYYVNGQRVPLDPIPGSFSVKYRHGEHADAAEMPVRARRFLKDNTRFLGSVPEYGLQIYQAIPSSGRDQVIDENALALETLREVRFLNTTDPIVFATPVYRQGRGNNPMLVTNQILVQFKPEVGLVQQQALHDQYNARVVEALHYVENGYLLELARLDEQMGVVDVANAYFESETVIFANPNFVTLHVPRAASSVATNERESAVSASRLSQAERQWHLALARVTDAWSITSGQSSIRIAVLDDGIDVGHPEFAGRVVDQFDFDSMVADGNPKAGGDNHGTACASVALAEGRRAFGVAPGCSLIAVRTPTWLAVSEEAEMFRWASDHGADVISCSWGPPDGTGPFPMLDATQAAISYCVTQGRNGRGIPIFFAAGNGNEVVSEDGYAAHPDVMAIAASTSEEGKASYSDFGPEIWVCAPSNGGTKAVFTADRRGNNGYNPSRGGPADDQDYSEAFGGTSSAAPLVAGVAGLMLSINRDLTLQEVREILRDTADKIGSSLSYDPQSHSEWFGYGRVNAQRAVQEAQRRATDGGSLDGDDGASTTGEPSIDAQSNQVTRSGPPPRFDVSLGDRSLYAVEVATMASLFDAASSQRSDNNFYASWQETSLLSAPTYQLPAAVWNRLTIGSRLYYRAHFADDANWANYTASVFDDEANQAPWIDVESDGSSVPPDGEAPSAQERVTYPSGEIFDVVQAPEGTVDYGDHVGNGAIPLIDTRGRKNDRVARNFTVDELDARDDARYARISVDLVERLQRLRDRVGGPIHVVSAYRHRSLNASVDGAERSQHIAGRAVDIWTAGLTPLELAELALEEMGCDIGIGLGRNTIHIDVRGTLTSWVYQGAEMNETEFDNWVRQQCRGRLQRIRRQDMVDRVRPTISGPERYPARAEPPIFYVDPGNNRYFAIEVATDWRLFQEEDGESNRDANNFFASWQEGLQEANGPLTFQLAEGAWNRLRTSRQLYYRALTTSRREEGWPDYQVSTPDEEAEQMPLVEITGTAVDRLSLPGYDVPRAAEVKHLSIERWIGQA